MFLRSKARPAHKADKLTALLTDYVENVGSSASQPCGPPRPVTGMALLFFLRSLELKFSY
jgi:hypothetical protein